MAGKVEPGRKDGMKAAKKREGKGGTVFSFMSPGRETTTADESVLKNEGSGWGGSGGRAKGSRAQQSEGKKDEEPHVCFNDEIWSEGVNPKVLT